jgi:hypothetical protein
MTCTYNDKPVKARPTIPVKRERSSTPSTSTRETTISAENLHKISSNELYETFRSSSKTRRQFGTSLLFDFYTCSLHSTSVWTRFIECFHLFCNYPQERLKGQLVKEAFRLFVTHNLLYSAFIHSQLVLENALSLPLDKKKTHSPKPTCSDSNDSMLIHIILALIFQTAYETLVNDTLSDHLSAYAHGYYRLAHQQFMEACFPYESMKPLSFTRKKNLVQASVLIAHFQCQVIDEEQAYMSICMGFSLAQQFDLGDINQDPSLTALLKVLDAWHVWLTFYLAKPYFGNELTSHELSNPSFTSSKSKEQQWALQVTYDYTVLFKYIIKKNKTSQKNTLNSIIVRLNFFFFFFFLYNNNTTYS